MAKIRHLSTKLTHIKLRSAVAKSLVDNVTQKHHIRQLQEQNDTRWHSTLTLLESYISLVDDSGLVKDEGIIDWDDDAIQTID